MGRAEASFLALAVDGPILVGDQVSGPSGRYPRIAIPQSAADGGVRARLPARRKVPQLIVYGLSRPTASARI